MAGIGNSQLSVKICSLFSGGGGLDLGFAAAGFDPVLAVDHDPAATESYARNLCRTRVEIADLAGEGLRELAARAKGLGVRGVVGGPPCQGFSNGNVGRGLHDPRNQLIFRFSDFLKHANCRGELDFFLLENVAGIRSPRNYTLYQRLITALSAAGFIVGSHDVDAVDFGVPQRRRRVFLVGLNARRFRERRIRIAPLAEPFRTVRDAIGGLPEPQYYARNLSESDIPFHPNHWTMQPRSRRFSDGHFNRYRSFRRIEWDAPSPTVAYGNREIHVHPEGHRRLSVFEGMLLQGLPKRYVLKGNFSEQVTQLSNLVPPPMAQAAASAILEEIRG